MPIWIPVHRVELNSTSPRNFRKLGQRGDPMSFQRDKNRFIKHFKGNGRRMSAGCLQAGKLELSTTAPSEGEPFPAENPTLKLPKKSASHTSSHFQTSENELSLYGQKLLKDVLHQNEGGNRERVRCKIEEARTSIPGKERGLSKATAKEHPRGQLWARWRNRLFRLKPIKYSRKDWSR